MDSRNYFSLPPSTRQHDYKKEELRIILFWLCAIMVFFCGHKSCCFPTVRFRIFFYFFLLKRGKQPTVIFTDVIKKHFSEASPIFWLLMAVQWLVLGRKRKQIMAFFDVGATEFHCRPGESTAMQYGWIDRFEIHRRNIDSQKKNWRGNFRFLNRFFVVFPVFPFLWI